MSSSQAAALPVSGEGPNLIQFLESVPPPITLLLVDLAPVISQLRWAAEVLSWKSHWTDPWLTLAGWWALCLSTNVILRYFLPLVLLLPAVQLYLPFRRRKASQAPTTEKSITISLADIIALQTLIPTLPAIPHVPFATALRISSILYVPYTLTTYLVPMPILLGVAGTVLITYRAPWACTLRQVLGRSAYVRRFLLRVWSILSGSDVTLFESLDESTQGLSSATSQFGHSQNSVASAPTSPPARFIFTILECQRWWMGLDWTAALLPGERPSWCGLSHQPVPPPSAFTLPPPTSVFLATPDGTRVKRTATWRWEDNEWGVLINKDGGEMKRIERKPPGVDEEEGGVKIATRAASILKERSVSIGSSSEVTAGKDHSDSGTGASTGAGVEQELGEDLPTDVDGWIFGDNKWEGASAKGGMGKYTRYRRWTRIAVLEESVETVGPGRLGIVKDTADYLKSANEQRPDDENHLLDGKERGTAIEPGSPKQGHHLPDNHGGGDERGSPLRERLKSAMKGVRSVS